jgi:hypothetical protein
MKLAWLAGVLLLALVGCGPDPSVTPVPEGALMAVISRGGMCPAGACESAFIVERDGLVHLAAKPPNDIGQVLPDDLAALEQAIAAADYEEIRSHPFTGMCPTAVDGQELVFEFNAPAGIERIESCRVAVDYSDPLFKAVDKAIGAYVGIAHED